MKPEELVDLIKNENDYFNLNSFSTDASFLFSSLNPEQKRAFFEGCCPADKPEPSRRFITCLNAIYQEPKENHYSCYIRLAAYLHKTGNLENYFKEIGDFQDGKVDSLQTKAMLKFVGMFVLSALKASTTDYLLNLLAKNEPGYFIHILNPDSNDFWNHELLKEADLDKLYTWSENQTNLLIKGYLNKNKATFLAKLKK